jgi:hypothetical protein
MNVTTYEVYGGTITWRASALAEAGFNGTFAAPSATFNFSYDYSGKFNSSGWIKIEDATDSIILYETALSGSGAESITVSTPVGHNINVSFGISAHWRYGKMTLNYQMGVAFEDNDGDGYTEDSGDCDDADPDINPGMTEIPYNGSDDDCDPATPDDDLDGDGYSRSEDCDDSNSSVNPAAVEIKHDGIDQDCNGFDLTIDIIKAEYDYKRDSLKVTAISSLNAGANLYLVDYRKNDFIKMTYNDGRWKVRVQPAGGNPESVSVIGKEGRESTEITALGSQFATGSITVYDANGQYLGILLGHDNYFTVHVPLYNRSINIDPATGGIITPAVAYKTAVIGP